MVVKVWHGGFGLEFLENGDELNSGGSLGKGRRGVRIDGMAELTGRDFEMAALAKALYARYVDDGTFEDGDKILVVGDPVQGLEFFGPFRAGESGSAAYNRMLALDNSGEPYVQAQLKPMTELVPVEPDPVPGADVEVPGVGTFSKDSYYFTLCRDGKRFSAFALVGRELIEVGDLVDGEPIDWSQGSICDPVRGDDGFFYPAYALLRFMNTDWVGETSWAKQDHDELTEALRRCKVESWTYDSGQDCYRVSVGADDEFVIRTPQQAQAYVAGLHAVRSGK